MSEGRSPLESQYPGSRAGRPRAIPAAGWWQITKRAVREAQADQVPLLAAGVAFYAFLSLFPAMIAAVMIYGLVADPATVAAQAQAVSEALPRDAASLVIDQMRTISSQPQGSLGLGALVAIALALWSASGGVGNLMTAINLAYDETETRGFVKRKLLSLALTLGAILFTVVAVTLITVVPALLDTFVPSGVVHWLLQAARWGGLVLAVGVSLAVLYRVGPDRNAPRLTWVSVGAAVATVIWILASLGFALYVDYFGSYSKTYGTLAGVAVLMLWLWITALIVLLGAEINAEAEQQTMADTTVGAPEPLGQRGAVKADTLPWQDPEVRERSS